MKAPRFPTADTESKAFRQILMQSLNYWAGQHLKIMSYRDMVGRLCFRTEENQELPFFLTFEHETESGLPHMVTSLWFDDEIALSAARNWLKCLEFDPIQEYGGRHFIHIEGVPLICKALSDTMDTVVAYIGFYNNEIYQREA